MLPQKPDFPALFVTFEGIDGSGKATQVQECAKLWRECESAYGAAGVNPTSLFVTGYPQYRKTDFGRFISQYLRGDFGCIGQNNPFLVSLLYSFDRWQHLPKLMEALISSEIVLCDRYTESNLAHQGSKMPFPISRIEMMKRIYDIETKVLMLPHPDLTIMLDIPVELAMRRIAEERAKKGEAPDLHEENREHLESTRDAYFQAFMSGDMSTQPWYFVPVDAGMSIKQIARKIWFAICVAKDIKDHAVKTWEITKEKSS